MVEIIKHGKIPEPKKYRCTCYHCSTIFDFYEHEARRVDTWVSSEIYIKCPVCNTECSVAA